MSPRRGTTVGAAVASANVPASAPAAAALSPQSSLPQPPKARAKRTRKQQYRHPVPRDTQVDYGQKRLTACGGPPAAQPAGQPTEQPSKQPTDIENGRGKRGEGNGSTEVTPKKQQYTMSKRLSASSKYLGVDYHAKTGKWRAAWSSTYIGVYATEDEAARARWEFGQKRAPNAELTSTPISKLLASKVTAETPPPVARRRKRKAAVPPAGQLPSKKTSVSQFFAAGPAPALQSGKAAAPPRGQPPTKKTSVSQFFSAVGGQPAAAKQPLALLTPAAQSGQAKASGSTFAKRTMQQRNQRRREKAAAKRVARPAATQVADPDGEMEAGKERTPEQQERMDRVEDATPAEEAMMPRWLRTFEAWMLARGVKETTMKSYRGSLRLLYEEDRKSPAGMATREYWQLVSQSAKNSSGGHLRSSSVGLWSEFLCDHIGKKASLLEPPSDSVFHRVRSVEEFKTRRWGTGSRPKVAQTPIVDKLAATVAQTPAVDPVLAADGKAVE